MARRSEREMIRVTHEKNVKRTSAGRPRPSANRLAAALPADGSTMKNSVRRAIDLHLATHINAPDFVKVAEAVGGHGEQVTKPEKLQDALKRRLEANGGKPAIIDVMIREYFQRF